MSIFIPLDICYASYILCENLSECFSFLHGRNGGGGGGFFTDNNTTPTKVVLNCFGLLVGLWQLIHGTE
jgi:hypothetical protein